MDDDLNSSDVEVEEAVKPFASAGAQSIADLLDRAVEDRLESKKRSKQLGFTYGCRKTQYLNHLWYNRFQGFREGVLRVLLTTTPVGEQIERFIDSIAGRIKPKGAHKVPSYLWIQQGVLHLVDSVVFYHREFTLSKHERLRIQSTIHRLFHEGKLTKDPSTERNYIGVFLVRKLSTGIFKDALTSGTRSWDVTLAKILSIVLTSALAARTGDLTVGELDDHELPFLTYGDITLKLYKGAKLVDLVANVVIRNEKGRKGNGQDNRTVKLEALNDAANNAICPLKLLLIVALRLGNVQAVTVDEVLRTAAARNDKTIQWVHPRRPVLCAFGPGISRVLADKPANSHQLSHTMAHAAPIAGFLAASIRSHDLRRGAAQDAANLKTKIKGHATDAVAESLGHNDTKTTKRYIGGIRDSIYTMRVEENFQDPFDLATTDSRYVKRRRLSPAIITEMCEKQGLDPSVTKNRNAMSNKVTAESLEAWVTEANISSSSSSVLSEDTVATGDDAPTTPSYHEEQPSDSSPKRIDTVDFAIPKTPLLSDTLDFEILHDNRDTLQFFPTDETTPVRNSKDTVVETSSTLLHIDPRLLTGECDFRGVVEANSEQPTVAAKEVNFDEIGTAVVEEAYFDEIVSQTVPTTAPELLIDAVDFVRFFSKINVSTNQVLAQKGYHKDQLALAQSFYVTHSQDPVTLWLYPCENAKFGCSYQNSFCGAVRDHQLACKIKSTEAFVELSKVKAFPCDRSGCKSSFDNKGRLNNHINEVHEWKPRSCKVEGCDPKVVFESRTELKRHQAANHSPYTPTLCQFPGCSSKVEYANAGTYRRHLDTHGLRDRKEKDRYMPGKRPPYIPSRCQFPGCSSKFAYTTIENYRKHLRTHGLKDGKEREKYMP